MNVDNTTSRVANVSLNENMDPRLKSMAELHETLISGQWKKAIEVGPWRKYLNLEVQTIRVIVK